MARTQGRITGVKRSTETIQTVTGTIATHVEAANDARIGIAGHVKALTTTGDRLALVGISVGSKMLAELSYHRDGSITLLNLSGQPIRVES